MLGTARRSSCSRKITLTSHKRLFLATRFRPLRVCTHRSHATRDRPDPACVSYDPGSPTQQEQPNASQSIPGSICKLWQLFTQISRRASLCEARLSRVAQRKAMIGGDHENAAGREWEQIFGHYRLLLWGANFRRRSLYGSQ